MQRLFLFILFALLVLGANPRSTLAQSDLQWAPPERVPFSDDGAGTPILLADQNRTVHAFNTKWYEDRLLIVYSTWSVRRGWARPVDIMMPPFKNQARLRGVHLDDAGIFHMVFFSGDDLEANFYYSQAPADRAHQASAWSAPQMIGPEAITPTEGILAGDGSGNLLLVYAGNARGSGLYSVHSADGGQTWSEPQALFLTFSDELRPLHLTHLSNEDEPQVHVAWSVANETGNSEAVHYARFETAEKAWSEPITIADVIQYEADTPALAEYSGQLFVVYHNDEPTTHWMRRSADKGLTWSEAVAIHPRFVGSNGPPFMVVDGADVLHMFFGNRTGDPQIHGVWHATWQEGRWSAPTAVVSGPRIVDEPGGAGFDPWGVTGAISQGRTLLLTWRTDPGAGSNGIHYTYADLGTPELPVVPLPTGESLTGETGTALPTIRETGPAPTQPATVAETEAGDSDNQSFNSRTANVMFGVGPSIALVVIVVVVYLSGHRGRLRR